MSVYIAMGFSYRINIVWGGGGVFILIPATGKEQESEIPKNAGVFQVLLAGIVVINFPKLDPSMIHLWFLCNLMEQPSPNSHM